MQIEIEFTVGDKRLKITEEVEGHAEFFTKMEFWDSIPRTGPNGETDLKFVHRTPKGYDYYEVICESAKMRFQFGQSREDKGRLFPKGWTPMHEGDEHEEAAAPAVPKINESQIKTINQLFDDITRLRPDVGRTKIIKKCIEVIGRECETFELTQPEAVKVITFLRNKAAEIKTSMQQKKGMA